MGWEYLSTQTGLLFILQTKYECGAQAEYTYCHGWRNASHAGSMYKAYTLTEMKIGYTEFYFVNFKI
jgi:hypothetical protein